MAIDSLDAGLSEDELEAATLAARAEFLQMGNEVKASGSGTQGWFALLFHKTFAARFHLQRRVGELEARIEAQEQRSLADAYVGTFDTDQRYLRGQVLTHGGALWLCLRDVQGEKPGPSTAFRLILKGAKP